MMMIHQYKIYQLEIALQWTLNMVDDENEIMKIYIL